MRTMWLVMSLVAAVACDRGPTAPTLVGLVLTPAVVTAPRNGSTQVTAQLQRSDGTLEDVTAAAVWTSSAPAVVTVQGGLVNAIGVGTATVTVTHSGLTRAIEVVARRNTRLVGALTISDVQAFGYSMHSVEAFLDGRMVNAHSSSGGDRLYRILIGETPYGVIADTSVVPGTHELSVRVTKTQPPYQGRYTSSEDSYMDVWDSDTGEVLTRIGLPVQEQQAQAGPADVTFVWPLQIGIFR